MLTLFLLGAGVVCGCDTGVHTKSRSQPIHETSFSFAGLIQSARELSETAYVPGPRPFVRAEDRLNYDQYREVRYRGTSDLGGGDPAGFALRYFHCGYLFPCPVSIHMLDGERDIPVLFAPERFAYSSEEVRRKASATPGFAGFRVHYPINRKDIQDEIASFLGASYFRAVPRGGVYGASARGLALDTALEGKREEFPDFTRFWIQRPRPGGQVLIVFALMESPSVVGAFQLDIRPGNATRIVVDAHLYFRNRVSRLGIAPLTSEFYYGESQPPQQPDPRGRPAVHDSDGLLIASGTGEWIWRPLSNRRSNQVSVFTIQSLRGFGLLQRDRDPDHYRDANAPERRPSVWVQLGLDEGSVQLVELAAADEYLDNIAAFWVPALPPPCGDPLRLHYELRFMMDGPAEHSGAWASRTKWRNAGPDTRQYEIDFSGGPLSRFVPEASVDAVVTATGGTVGEVAVGPGKEGGDRRVRFGVCRPGASPVTLRVFLRSGRDTLSETWTDLWTP